MAPWSSRRESGEKDEKTSTRRGLRERFLRSKSPAPPLNSEAQLKNQHAYAENSQLPVISSNSSHTEDVEGGCLEAKQADSTRDMLVQDSAVAVVLPVPVSRESTIVDIDDIPGSAYEKAWLLLTEEQRKELTTEGGIKELFNQLNQADNQHEKSLLRKGLKAMNPYLKGFVTTIDLVSPFASVEPAAGTALGLVKGVTSIAVAICGAADDLTSQIKSFLEHIPAIDRCNEVAKSRSRMADIHNALIKVYKDLLEFYFKTVTLFRASAFVLRIAVEMLKPEMPEIISSFKEHADVLSKLLESETFATVQEIKDELVDALIRDTLDINRGREVAFHNGLKRRADDACSWITSEDAFTFWVLNSGDSKLLAMLGDMGCGKTVTTAYLVDQLSPGRIVCSYYCRNDQETTKLGNIYRSLIWQLLKRRPELKSRFYDWNKRAEQQSAVSPTQSDDDLEEFLCESLSASKAWTFVVLDGLDECEIETQEHLLSFFGNIFRSSARLKVFISMRHNEEVESSFPADATRLEIKSSMERDRIVTTYLVNQTNLPEKIRGLAIDELSEMANGSAIWLRLALEYIKKLRVQNERGLRNALEQLPSSTGLAELYWKIFDKACAGIPDNEERLQKALEIMTISRRPLSSEELSYAVFIDPENDSLTTLSELREEAGSVNLQDLIRSFISITSVDGEEYPQLRLVHQSLKELVLQAAPSRWASVGKTKADKQNMQRLAELNGSLLKRCIKYLLLEECEKNSLLSSFEDGTDDGGLAAMGGDLFDDELEYDDEGGAEAAQPPRDFNPSERGLGAFFAYAGSYWMSHSDDASENLRPDPKDLIVLCSAGSQRLDNWVNQWQRPNCTYRAARLLTTDGSIDSLDPLVVTAICGSAASMIDLLKSDLQTKDFLPGSVWIAIEYLIQRQKISIIRNLFMDKSFGPILCHVEFFYKVVWSQSEPDKFDDKATKEWTAIFDSMIRQLDSELLEDDLANDILCCAASSGWLVLVQRLFAAADHNSHLRDALLIETRSRVARTSSKMPKLRALHQSVGEAAFGGYGDIVQFLCHQPGIEPHLHYIDENGQTVFHHAARYGRPNVFQILIEKWPEGIEIADEDGNTPTRLLAFNCTSRHSNWTRTIKLLLATGKVDTNTSFGDGEGYSILCTALRSRNTEVCEALIVEGSADLSSTVGVDEAGKPFWREFLLFQPVTRLHELMLKRLCRLLPIAVSTEFLFGDEAEMSKVLGL